MSGINGPRATSNPALRPQFLCLHCRPSKWRHGGASSLGRHLAVHGGAQEFPSYQLVDADENQLDFDVNPTIVDQRRVPASIDVDGWLRSRPLVLGHIDRTEATP